MADAENKPLAAEQQQQSLPAEQQQQPPQDLDQEQQDDQGQQLQGQQGKPAPPPKEIIGEQLNPQSSIPNPNPLHKSYSISFIREHMAAACATKIAMKGTKKKKEERNVAGVRVCVFRS